MILSSHMLCISQKKEHKSEQGYAEAQERINVRSKTDSSFPIYTCYHIMSLLTSLYLQSNQLRYASSREDGEHGKMFLRYYAYLT